MRPAENVQDLINLLHIDVIGREIESVHDQIREAYVVPSTIAEDYEDFKAIVTHYYQYHFALWHGVDFAMPPDMSWSRVRTILEATPRPDARLARIRGFVDTESGWVQAVKNGLRGRNGGLIGVIDAIAERLKREAIEQYVQAVFIDCVNPLDFDTRVRFMEQYIERYGRIALPNEELLSKYELAANMDAVIQNHVQLINQLRNTVQ